MNPSRAPAAPAQARTPRPRPRSYWRPGTRTPVKRGSDMTRIARSPSSPMTEMLRTRSSPGAFIGTMIWLARSCGFASGAVTAMTIANAAPSALGREPFVAVDHVLAAVTTRGGRHPDRVRPRELRLGHREAAARVSPRASEGPSHAAFCPTLSMSMQQIHNCRCPAPAR